MDRIPADTRLLVVEDEIMVCLILEDMLAELGFTSVTACATVTDAMALIEGQRFDAVTLDINLGGTRSDAVADRLAALQVPFVFATGYDRAGVAANHAERPLLRKPFRKSEVAAALDGLLA